MVLSDEPVKHIDSLAGRRHRSSVLTEAGGRELRRLRQLKALDELMPWNEKDHPELKQGAAKWVRQLRRENDRRLARSTAR